MPRDYTAKLVVYGYDKMSKASRKRLISWLRVQADFLEIEKDNISSRFIARMMKPNA